MESLSNAQARRIALVAQGFGDRPHHQPTLRTLARTIGRTGVLQIDSVNVLVRAHFLPLYSRMGPYDPDLLHRASSQHPRRLVEYWAHVASFMPVELWPYMRHRMRRFEREGLHWEAVRHNPALVDTLLAELRAGGAQTARALDTGLPRTRDHWGWNWSESKKVLEFLFFAGRVAIAGRTSQFERLYDLPERVIPAHVLDQPEPTASEAAMELTRRAARSHGVATARDLADYYRMKTPVAQHAAEALVDAGELERVRVEGWGAAAYLHRDARIPRRVTARTLLSPFDPVVWERARSERLFGFRYRIGIYTPPAQRTQGYYALPFLLGERIVARADLKADRNSGVLRVMGAWAEDHAPPDAAGELAAELRRMAGWLGLSEIAVDAVGDLGPALRAQM